MTQEGSEEVRTSRWTPRQRLSGTTGGTSGSTLMSLKLSDSSMRSEYESGIVKDGFSFNSRRTPRWTSRGTTGGTSGSTLKSLFLGIKTSKTDLGWVGMTQV